MIYIYQLKRSIMRPKKIKEILTFLQRTNKLKAVPRYGSTLNRDQDSVAEHSWRLALMAYVIGNECKVQIDIQRAMALALIHDLAEARTGDTDAFEVISGNASVDEKKKMEQKAIQELTQDFSFGDWIRYIWEEYENQETIEAKFVKALDKIEAFLHIAERGVEAYIPREFHSNYADKAVEAFDEASKHFPEVRDLLEMVKKDLKVQFTKVGVQWTTSD